jgi:SAM-dependent methyltransferase
MPQYKVRNVLEARGIKAFWKLEAGITRGQVPLEGPDQEQSRERIKKLQQELHAARQELTAKNRQLKQLNTQQKQPGRKGSGQTQTQAPGGASGGGEAGEVDAAAAGATLPIPPRDMGPITQARELKSYLRTGRSIKNRILHYTGVTPASSILDIGAGPGRVARHFVDFVEPPGRYVGVDIEKPNMDWCQENIAAANPAFNFFHQNVHNGMYNPGGEYRASEYRFPFEDDSFDLIFLTSVFTHLVPEDARNYLREISRLLKPDGVCFCTWFLLGHDLGVKYMNAHSKEGRAGFGFRYVLEMLDEAGLTLAQEPALGSWRGQEPPYRNENAGGQDILLLGRSRGEDELLSRYGSPVLPHKQTSDLEEATGAILMFDPVSNSLTISDGEEEKTIGVPAEAELRMNGQSVDSAALRPGQQATVRLDETTTAGAVYATDPPQERGAQMRRISGTLEALDRERGLFTLIVGNRVRTFELDPESLEIRSGAGRAGLDDLSIGQGVAIEKVDGRGIVHSLG